MFKNSFPSIDPDQRLRVLFYLPVVTPWWFANIIVHLIRNLAQEHEVHVMVPPLWRGTGLGPNEVRLIADLAHAHWHVLDGPDHPSLRCDASGEEELLDLVRDIDPQITLCRSADIKTPARFPGIVRYVMEGAAPPFSTLPNWIWLSPTLFDHGLMPDLPAPLIARLDAKLDAIAEPHWTGMLQKARALLPPDFAAQAGLPSDKKIIGLALEYEHEENFFSQHHLYADNAAMVTQLAAQLCDNFILAVTNHPLTERHGNTSCVKAAIAASSGKAVLLKQNGAAGDTTLALAQHCDGMIVGNSKSWSACAAVGTPVLRYSDFATGEWASAYSDLGLFLDAIAEGCAAKADPQLARRWFTFQLANNVFDPCAPNLTPTDIINRIIRPVAPERWANGLARYEGQLSGKRVRAA